MVGDPGPVLTAYLDAIDDEALTSDNPGAAEESLPSGLELTGVVFHGADGHERQDFSGGEDITACIGYRARGSIPRPHICLSIVGPQGGMPLIQASMLVDGCAPESLTGEGTVSCTFKAVPLMPRAYHLWAEVWGDDCSWLLVPWRRLGSFRISGPDAALAPLKGAVRHTRAEAPIRVPHIWQC
jgi:hypothetical protein